MTRRLMTRLPWLIRNGFESHRNSSIAKIAKESQYLGLFMGFVFLFYHEN